MGHDSANAGTPPPVERGMVTLSDLKVGMKPLVEKDGEKRRAEILSIQPRAAGLMFYVHYDEFNKRLDEWVSEPRLDLTQQVEWTVALPEDKTDKKMDARKSKGFKSKSTKTPKLSRVSKASATGPRRSKGRFSRAENSTTPGRDPNSADAPSPSVNDDKSDSDMDGDTELIDIDAAANDTVGHTTNPEEFDQEVEIEKLRTGGSMTQNQAEISRMRNLLYIQMGGHRIETWYFSPYPLEFSDCDDVYICEFCLCYYGQLKQFNRHRRKCTLAHPPGNEIYRDDYVSFFEIDGRRQRTWCRNLCLLSKLFLDHKALYYDVDPFLFYCMCTQDEHGYHLVGYFSKEKESADGYNVACILTLPQFQRKGFGKLLIEFSYELSKREKKLGSPEKPLSDLGLLSYRAYWQETVLDMVLDDRTSTTIEELGGRAAMTTNDVIHTLQYLKMLGTGKSNQFVIVLPELVEEQHRKQKERQKIKGKRFIDPEKLQWTIPTFTSANRTWGW